MSIECDMCENHGATARDDAGELEMFRCHLCERVYCADCLMRYAEADAIITSGRTVNDEEMKTLETLGSCEGCKALTMDLWPCDDEEEPGETVMMTDKPIRHKRGHSEFCTMKGAPGELNRLNTQEREDV